MKKILWGLLLSLAILASFSIPAKAQNPEGDLRITTSSLPINLKVIPGTSISAQIKIKNDGIGEENIKVSLMKFKADEATGTPMLAEREQGDDFFDWVNFSENNFPLPVNEWKTVTATFNVPKTASFGYYYAIVFSRAEENVTRGERQTVITGGTATLVLLEAVVPDAKREVEVTGFSADKKIYEFLPATFTVKLRNTGNVHIAPRGNIFINSGDEKDIAILEINPNKGSILPNSPREFSEKWKDGFPYYDVKQIDDKIVLDDAGKYVQELKWNFGEMSKLRWGKHTAKLLLYYDDGTRDIPIESEISFWVVPWRLIFGFLGILFLLFFAGRLSTKIKFPKKN
ncbi:MAG: hypothetical protein ACD_15C00225G0019 [uncultured bacterium]|nr:MAG: hypothetical protein ACD_15C00225G0019 [uncultured bacterium]HCU71084.1 hypothetical protein [Candidatus Moranbacteria bacterium]